MHSDKNVYLLLALLMSLLYSAQALFTPSRNESFHNGHIDVPANLSQHDGNDWDNTGVKIVPSPNPNRQIQLGSAYINLISIMGQEALRDIDGYVERAEGIALSGWSDVQVAVRPTIASSSSTSSLGPSRGGSLLQRRHLMQAFEKIVWYYAARPLHSWETTFSILVGSVLEGTVTVALRRRTSLDVGNATSSQQGQEEGLPLSLNSSRNDSSAGNDTGAVILFSNLNLTLPSEVVVSLPQQVSDEPIVEMEYIRSTTTGASTAMSQGSFFSALADGMLCLAESHRGQPAYAFSSAQPDHGFVFRLENYGETQQEQAIFTVRTAVSAIQSLGVYVAKQGRYAAIQGTLVMNKGGQPFGRIEVGPSSKSKPRRPGPLQETVSVRTSSVMGLTSPSTAFPVAS